MPRGGARPGAGAKKKVRKYSEGFREALTAALERKAKATGQNIHEVLVDMAYDKDNQAAVRISAIKQVVDVLVPKVSEKHVTQETTVRQGALILPALEVDPASEHGSEETH